MVLGILCVGVAATSSRAQSDPDRHPAPPPAPVCTSTLDVHAVEAATHEAVAAATVTVNGQPAGETGDDGHVMVRGLCPGAVEVVVERIDCVPARRTVTLGAAASLEVAVASRAIETVIIEDRPPDPVDMRSTAVVDGEALERTRGRGFSDALAEVPGVSQLRSSSGMAKPIIRGQFGRRLLILVDAVRHRAQEWGLDHAPEIDPFVADKLTVVRGASGVRYGPDAIGGAVLVDPPPLLTAPGLAAEAHLVGLSNGRGGSFASRLRAAPARWPGLAVQAEGSFKRLAAPSTPDYALDNTGAAEWNAGATAGYRHGDAEYKLSYLHYQAQLGVCSCLRIDTIEDFEAQLQRDRPVGSELFDADFEIERPYQAAAHDLAVARGRWTRDHLGTLIATYAFQHDHRREYEIVRDATTGPQFDFRLMTHELELALEHRPIHVSDHLHLRGEVGVIGMAQTHRYSGLQLVPDHTSGGGGVYAIERLIGHTFELEAGVRYDFHARRAAMARIDYLRLVRSGQLAMDACGDSDGDPVSCGSQFHTLSASLGGLRQLGEVWSIKLELSTASRPPNPDEQYLNGTSPTFPVLALGKPDLGAETTYSTSATTSYQGDRVTAELSGFANLITDYIYFAPAIGADGEPIYDVLVRGTFPRFITRPVDAVFYGADGGIAATPWPALELGAQLSVVRARNVSDDAYLVFVPPDRVRGAVTYRPPAFGEVGKGFVSMSGTYVARQGRFDAHADLAEPPPAYFLLGAEVGAEARRGRQTFKLGLQGTNLLNARYRDYTSLLRYFADQPGWQLMVRLSVFVTPP